MKTYHTSESAEGLRLPHSGRIIGELADALRLKATLRKDWSGASYKTAQRFFKGDRIDPKTVDAILNALVDSLVPATIKLGGSEFAGAPFTLRDLIRTAVYFYARVWDHLAADANAHGYAVTEPQHLPVPALRLIALDLGIRYGAWSCLCLLRGRGPEINAESIGENSFGLLLSRLQSSRKLTIEKLAEQIEVTPQAVELWRSGNSLPTNEHIESLAGALCSDAGTRQRIEYQLRIRVAIQALRSQLIEVCGKSRVEDMLSALLRTAEIVYETFCQSLPTAPPEQIAQIEAEIWDVVLHGAQCERGESLSLMLAEMSQFNQEVAADFSALPGDWSDRISYWQRFFGSLPHQLENVREHFANVGHPVGAVEEIAPFAVEMSLHMGGFDFSPPEDWTMIRIEHPPEGKAVNQAIQADRAVSIGRVDLGIEHYRRASKHQPLDPNYHFKLGALLAQEGFKFRRPAQMEEGLLECRLAVELDPEFGNARNEIGIILSNMRRHEEAEAAFAASEPYHGHHSHHWICRGKNYLPLERYEEAIAAFRKAIEQTKDKTHLQAKAMLAASLMATGKTGEARRIGKDVEHHTGTDPTERWEELLDVWLDRHK